MPALLLALLLTGYDPLSGSADASVEVKDLTVHDSKRGRDVPVRVFASGVKAAPVILFSHGLGGSRELNAFLGRHWASRGFVAVFLQHPGSDTSTWSDVPPAQRKRALERAASLENFKLRVEDVSAVLDALTVWNRDEAHPLLGRMNLARVGMSGHSFGAVTTQAVSGQRFPLGQEVTEPRITAAMALSPSVPRIGSAKDGFEAVKIPWLLMTGTHDQAAIGGQTAQSRLGVFAALPPGQKYELVLEGAEHSAFTDRALPGDHLPRNPNHHRAMMAISTAFFESTLKADAAARAWLEGDGVKSVLEPKDRWQRK